MAGYISDRKFLTCMNPPSAREVCSVLTHSELLPRFEVKESPSYSRPRVPTSFSVMTARIVSYISSLIIAASPSCFSRCCRRPASVNLSSKMQVPSLTFSTCERGIFAPCLNAWLFPNDGGEMHRLNRLKFSLYGSCSDGLTEERAPSSAAILGSIAINIISFTTLCAHENSSIHSTKNGGATSAQGMAMSDASLATDRINSSLILLLFGGEAIV